MSRNINLKISVFRTLTDFVFVVIVVEHFRDVNTVLYKKNTYMLHLVVPVTVDATICCIW